MAEHPIEGMMGVTMEKIRQLVDANTIIGEPITVDGATIIDRKSTRLNSSHPSRSRMPSSA